MDWYLRGDDPASATALRHEITAYLRRHADPDSDLDSAELVVSEMLGNLARHAGGPAWVSLTWPGEMPVVTVRDLGPGFDPSLVTTIDFDDIDPLAESGRGLFLITALAPAVEAAERRGAGMVLDVTLPVTRRAAVDHDPPRRLTSTLPALDEALPEGGFGRESFLRALVVQLAQSVEFQHGPDAADAAVAQVGTDVGARMEEEFRLARRLTERLTPEQMGECYVRLKHAIEGGFSVVEATEDRIVLVNTRCPFGDAVQLAPSLCRMTSSVFGGIAARNSDGPVRVLLEERIAVGDPGCRVVVDLTGTGVTTAGAHLYEEAGRDLSV